MTEEEKKAISLLKSYENKLVYEISDKDKKAVKTLLNLIEKQQKEIEDLKENKDTIYISNRQYGKTYNITKDYISKDKIREKIKELEKEKGLYFEKQIIQGKIDLLKELLEE